MNKWCVACNSDLKKSKWSFIGLDLSDTPPGSYMCESHPRQGIVRFKQPTEMLIEKVKVAIKELEIES